MCYDHRTIIMDIASVGEDSERSRRWEVHSGLSSVLKWAGLRSCVIVCDRRKLEGHRCLVVWQRSFILDMITVRAEGCRCCDMAANWNNVCVGLQYRWSVTRRCAVCDGRLDRCWCMDASPCDRIRAIKITQIRSPQTLLRNFHSVVRKTRAFVERFVSQCDMTYTLCFPLFLFCFLF
jgi:hypothetical protein